MTSNLAFSQWEGIFKDPMTTAGAIDRLVHHSVIIELNITSYRLEDAMKPKPEPGPAAKPEEAAKQRIDSSVLLPAWAGCLTKILPVEIRHDGQQNSEATEFGNQTRID